MKILTKDSKELREVFPEIKDSLNNISLLSRLFIVYDTEKHDFAVQAYYSQDYGNNFKILINTDFIDIVNESNTITTLFNKELLKQIEIKTSLKAEAIENICGAFNKFIRYNSKIKKITYGVHLSPYAKEVFNREFLDIIMEEYPSNLNFYTTNIDNLMGELEEKTSVRWIDGQLPTEYVQRTYSNIQYTQNNYGTGICNRDRKVESQYVSREAFIEKIRLLHPKEITPKNYYTEITPKIREIFDLKSTYIEFTHNELYSWRDKESLDFGIRHVTEEEFCILQGKEYNPKTYTLSEIEAVIDDIDLIQQIKEKLL